jgi:hypothetical protein
VTRCSVLSAELGEPLAATAPVARSWLVLEQPGPWGRVALTQSHLDATLGAELEERAAGTGVRILLIRRPGRHADLRVDRERRLYFAHTVPGASWLEQAVVADPKDLLDLDFTALGAGRVPGLGTLEARPVGMVCTNARRDRCCAERGRPVANALGTVLGDRIWESTHLGGHRFAPTALVLPHGLAYGRLTSDLAFRVMAAAEVGQVVLDGYRGRSTWERPGQAAEIAVRRLLAGPDADTEADTDAGALTVAGEAPGPAGEPPGPAGEGTWSVSVVHRDGRRWSVQVVRRLPTVARPESCGKDPAWPDSYVALSIRPA